MTTDLTTEEPLQVTATTTYICSAEEAAIAVACLMADRRSFEVSVHGEDRYAVQAKCEVGQSFLIQLQRMDPLPAMPTEPDSVITLRLSKQMHAELKDMAYDSRISLNRLLLRLAEQAREIWLRCPNGWRVR